MATILTPADHGALADRLRQTLHARGWRLVGYSANMTRGKDNYRAMARRARYRLTLQSSPISACDTGDKSYRYQIALIENATGDAPVTLSGADCLNTIDEAFTTALDRDAIRPR